MPGPNGELAQLEFLLKAGPEQKLTREVFTFRSLVEYLSMWHKGLTVREVALWSEGGLLEYMKQLVKNTAEKLKFLQPSSALEQGTPV